MLFNLRTRTSKGATHLSSFVQCIGYLFAVLGPLAFGKLRTLTNSYVVAFSFLLIMSVVMLIAGYYSMKNNYLEDN